MENQAGLLAVARDGPAGQFTAPELANAGTVVVLFDAVAYLSASCLTRGRRNGINIKNPIAITISPRITPPSCQGPK